MDYWKDKVTAVSDKVFPGLGHHQITKVYDGNEVLSNLPLQMALYFNVMFAPFWYLVLSFYIKNNYNCFQVEIYKFILLTVLVTVFLIEVLRLYLGYKGNLEDKIPELAGFWMLSLILQFPLQSFLLFNPYFRLHVLELVAQSIMVFLLVAELITSYLALKYTASQQATHFRIMKLRSDVTVADIQEQYRINNTRRN